MCHMPRKTKKKTHALRKTQTKERTKANYIDNAEFFKEITEFQKQKKVNDNTPIPESLAVYFVKIAENLSNKGNFLSYTFKDEMISDGIENCLQYLHNFNPAKSKNPFSYFTQIIFFAFVRRIKKEKKQMYIKYKAFMNSDLSEHEEILKMLQDHDALKEHKLEFIANYERVLEEKNKKIKDSKLTADTQSYMDDDEE
jgi:hypothetical protein